MRLRYFLILIPFLFNTSIAHADDCTQISESCVEGTEARLVNGVHITRPCWKYRYIKKCATENYDQDCLAYKSNPSCNQIGSRCIDSTSGQNCSLYRNSFSCSSSINSFSPGSVLQCGSSIYCPSGNCEIPGNDGDSNFASSVSYLAMLNQAAKESNGDMNNLLFMSGRGNSCDRAITGYNNCCTDEGWGQDYASAACSESENNLIQQKQKRLCHYVGDYCSRRVLGQCVKTTKAYCCFSSKLSRVLIEQGKAQLGISWGSAEAPECRGFTPDEMKRLRFDQMDLSEIKADISASISLPNNDVLENRVRQRVSEHGQR